MCLTIEATTFTSMRVVNTYNLSYHTSLSASVNVRSIAVTVNQATREAMT